MPRRRTEERFERRIQKILESKGWLLINCARSKPFDLVAIRRMLPVLIEVKGRKTRYTRKQFLEQRNLCKNTVNEFLIIKQSKKKGKITVETGYSQGYLDYDVKGEIEKDLEKWLE